MSDSVYPNYNNSLPDRKRETVRLNSVRILLVEDALENQILIKAMLENAGAEVTIAMNGRVGVDVAMQAVEDGTEFDVILMDMMMPVLDGYRTTKELRSRDYHGPIIAVTANAVFGDREKCLQSGCDDYQSKPIDRIGLFKAIRQQVEPPSPSSSDSRFRQTVLRY